MVKPSGSSKEASVSCDMCRKEVPLSEAVIPEAADYVAHFCGLDCYSQWKKQSEHTRQRGEKAKK